MRGTTKRRIGRKLGSLFLCFAMLLSLVVLPVQAATVDGTYTPGTYTGEALGYKDGKVTVTVTLAKDDEGDVVISAITADGSTQTPSLWAKAETLLAAIKEKNGTDGVDAVSGATNSSDAILEATDKALAQAVSGFAGGTGTQDDPYQISSEAGLRYLQAQVAAGTSYAGQYVELTSDIALTGAWTPIGSSAALAFAGTFDGNGHTISGMTITALPNPTGTNYIGLFGYTLNGVVIRDVALEDVDISISEAAQSVYAGALVAFIKVDTKGTASSVIDGCTASGSIDISTQDKVTVVGGLTGFTDQRAAITNCGTDMTVRADSGSGRATVGGLSAWASIRALFMNDYALGDVSVTTTCPTYGNVGGAFGQVNGIVYNVYTAGDVTLTAPTGATYQPGAIAGDLAAATYADSCYHVSDASAFGAGNGKSNAETIVKKTAAEVTSEDFAQLLHDGLAPSALATMGANVVKAEITGCDDFKAMTARVGDAFQDWTVSKGKVVLSGSLWTSGEIDADIFAGGDGTKENPYLIETAAQLTAFAGSMNDKIDYTGKYVALKNDIIVSSAAWTPIGGSSYLFNGTFDGKGHKISGMTLGTEDAPYALDREDLYIGLFGVLGSDSVVKDVHLEDVAFYTSYEATAYVGGIAGVMQGSTVSNDYTGAVIDGCSVAGTLSLTSTKGNQFVGGLVGMQYKGAIINSSAQVTASGVVTAGDLAEVGGLVGLNNRGLVANCWSDSTIYGSGSREDGNEGMAVVSDLIACNAGALVNCYGSGDVTTKEHSTYAGMVSGWVTGIGKSYTCWYDLGSTMTVGKDTDNPLIVNPVESVGTKVASGVNDEGDAYTGGLVDRMTGYSAANYAAVATALNGTFAAFPIDITAFGLDATALKSWTYDETAGLVTFGTDNGTVTYVQPDCEKVEKPAQTLQDGTWYGRDAEKTTVVKITVEGNAITATEVLSGADSGDAYDAAMEKAEYKATYGDFSHYEAADTSRFAGGSGTQTDPYLIANESQLRYLSSSVNADVDWSGVYFKQTADITLTGGDWQPVGWALNGEVNGKKTAIAAYPFRGNYDGAGHTISGLTIGTKSHPADQLSSGLFGLTAGAYSTNETPTGEEQVVRLTGIHLRDVSIHVATRYETYTGGLVGSGQNGIYIDDCSVTGTIDVETSESFARAGGLAASVLRGAVTNSWADVDITAVTDTNHVYAGGLYGMDNRVTTVNCYALGDVTGNSTNNNKVHIGGLVGQAGGIHVNCYAAGDVVSRKTTTDVGSLSGRSAGINIDYHSYYNTEATLKQGDTTISPATGVGVVTTNATEVDVIGKTAAQLKSADFAALLNSNITQDALTEAMTAIDEILAAPASGLAQANYYEGTALNAWAVKSGIVTFSTASVPTEGGGSSGGGGGGSAKPTTTPTTPTAPTTPTGLPFTDVKTGDWSYDSVRYVYEKGMMTGTAADEFSPNATVTRAMLVTILHRLEGAPTAAAGSFTDVPAGQWYTDAVAWAAANGIVNGTSATTFAPNDPVTREQFAAILYRYAAYKGMDSVTLAEVLGRFADCDACSAYAVSALEWAVQEGLIHGMTDTTLAPKGSATRAQAATILARFCESDILK